MSQIETLKALAQRENEKRLERLASQIEAVRQAKHRSAEELAATLEPLAQALAALTDETRQTLAEIERTSREQGERFSGQMHAAAEYWKAAATQAQWAAERLNQAGARMEWSHYALAALTGAITGALVSAFWLWLAPPTVQNLLDAHAVAETLKPAVIEALKPSRGR